MPEVKVLDASAIIAYLRNEAGADVVERILIDDECIAHAMNLCEVYRDCLSRGESEATADRIIEDLLDIGIAPRDDFDRPLWQHTARIKFHTPAAWADCIGLALTARLAATFVTADHGELDRIADAGHLRIKFIRPA